MTEITQAAREAAAGYMRASRIGSEATYRRYSEGGADNSGIVQAFAAHGHSEYTRGLEEAAKVAEPKRRDVATAIRALIKESKS